MDTANTIVVEENRDLIYKARMLYEKMQNKRDEISKSYEENIVDTGISADIEEKIEKEAEITKTVIGIAGSVATIILMVCPFDGPFGELVTLLATPAFIKLVDIAADFRKKAIITGKKTIEKHILKIDKKTGDGVGFNLENGDFVEDLSTIIQGADEISRGA